MMGNHREIIKPLASSFFPVVDLFESCKQRPYKAPPDETIQSTQQLLWCFVVVV